MLKGTSLTNTASHMTKNTHNKVHSQSTFKCAVLIIVALLRELLPDNTIVVISLRLAEPWSCRQGNCISNDSGHCV